MSEATVSGGITRGYFDYAVAKGAPADALTKRSGVDPALLDDADTRVPFENYTRLISAGRALTGDGALHMRFAEAIDMSEFSVVGLLANASETMMDAFIQ